MVTTIQVDKQTLRILKKFKEDLNAASYDEVINKMAEMTISKKSLFGVLGRSKSMKQILKGLRDEHDRI